MADAVVNILFQNLNDFLLQERSLLRGARSNFEDIKKELDSMRAFLRDADRRKDGDERLKTWVGEVREASYNVEDIIDEFHRHMNRPRRRGCQHFLIESIRLPRIIFHTHQLATRLQEAKSQIVSAADRKDRYQLDRTEDQSSSNNASGKIWQRRGETLLFMDDDKIVGLEKKVNELVGWLTEDDPKRTVVSVVGMGGSGKTTLVAQAYKNERVKRHFDCSIWVSVSQSYNFEELLRGVMKDVLRDDRMEPPSDLTSMNCLGLLRMVNEYLDVKRYVVVVDDAWSLDAWKELNLAFPRNSCGSRIMLTTRHKNIAFCLGDASRACELGPLQEKDAWDLFNKNAFWKDSCPEELEPLARSFLKRCEGLPLAIVALGSLLSLREKTVPEWNRVYNDLSRQLSQNNELEPIKHVLLLSFYDLPHNLKHCFLYCCLFPEDYLVYRKQLIRLWVAEGFIEDAKGITMEETADDYLKELIHRNMLHVIETNEFGRLKCFRMHDMVREVALSVSKEERFCMIYDGQQASQGEEFRRMSIQTAGEFTKLPTNMQHMRSLLVFNGSMSLSSSLNMMVSSCRLIRVLHLKGVPIKSLPDELTNLFNLRYLNLRNTQISKLPKSIGKLKNLETLDVEDTNLESLPIGIGELQKLRHLFCSQLIDSEYISFYSRMSMKIPSQLCQVTSLQTLVTIEAAGEIARQVGNLTQMRRFSTEMRAADEVDLCASISKMENLVRLFIRATNEEETLELEALSPTPPLLQKLSLRGHFEKMPRWLGSLTNLTYLWLSMSQLRAEEGNDLLLMLQKLLNLVFVILQKTIDGQEFVLQDGWFPKLKLLHIMDFTRLNRLVIEKGSMPSIQRLHLSRCRQLKTLPQGIEHLQNLQELILKEMPLEFVDKLRPKDGNEEHQKVANIPLIQHKWKTENGQRNIERLS